MNTGRRAPVVRFLQVPKKPFAPRRKIRLSVEAYTSGYTFSVTINTFMRRQLFAKPANADAVVASLRTAAEQFRAKVFAYCVMPDHVHILACTPGGVNFDTFVKVFKQEVGLALVGEVSSGQVWQPRYYDHALRGSESLHKVALYIWCNPVRAKLVESIGDYPGSGSLTWDGALFGV